MKSTLLTVVICFSFCNFSFCQEGKTNSNPCVRDSSCYFDLRFDEVNLVLYYFKTNRYLYSRDANGNIINTLLLGRDLADSISWINAANFVNTYDANNHLIDSLSQFWDLGSNQWVNNAKQILTYDLNGNWISATNLYYGSGTWESYDRTLHYYDLTNKRTLTKIQYWNSNSNLWLNTDSINYNYSNNKIHSMSYFKAYAGTPAYWTYDAKDTIHYNSVENPIYSLKKYFFNGTWNDATRNIWTYDINDRLIHRTTETWNGIGAWNTSESDYYSYDINNNVTLDSSLHLRHYYTCAVPGVIEKNKSIEFSVFPNPGNSIISIKSSLEFNTINIINSLGQIVSIIENKPKKILVSDLSNGIYFVQLLDKKGSVIKTEKFIKE